jgi:membrane associated rhomboid family serine protease
MAAAAERGSFQMLLLSITQIWLALKLWGDVEEWLAALIGSSGAAFVLLAIVMFRQEQRLLLLNPLGSLQKEVHADAIAKQGKGIWIGVGIWAVTLLAGTIFF